MRNFLIITIAVLISSCATGKKNTDDMNNDIFSKWELRELNGVEPNTDSNVYIELSTDNNVAGFVGCNRLMAKYFVEGKAQIKFEKLATTRMLCSDEAMNLENQVLKLLDSTSRFTLEDNKLILYTESETKAAVFYRKPDSEIVNTYWKLIKLGDKPVSMVENQEKEQYFMLKEDGTVAGFGGCNTFNGEYELSEGNKIKFEENLAVTMKLCPDVSVDENEFLEVFKMAENYTIDGDLLYLNSGSNTPLAVFEAVSF